MFRPRVIPLLLLKGKGLVKTVGFRNPVYLGDPMNAVKIFNEHEADELVILDITATIENRPISEDLVRKISQEAFMPVAVGGGINNLATVKKIIASGAEKVVINTAAVARPDFIREVAEECGSQSLIVSIDAKKNLFGKYRVCINSGGEIVSGDPVEHAQRATHLGAGEILINSVDLDGSMTGYDYELIKKIATSVDVPVVACGGAGNMSHFKKAIEYSHAHAVAAGSMFVFHGPRKAVLINYPDKKALRELYLSS